VKSSGSDSINCSMRYCKTAGESGHASGCALYDRESRPAVAVGSRRGYWGIFQLHSIHPMSCATIHTRIARWKQRIPRWGLKPRGGAGAGGRGTPIGRLIP
jgi:hypothetical protein